MTGEISVSTRLAVSYVSLTLNRAKADWNKAQEKLVVKRMQQIEKVQHSLESFGYWFELPSKDVVREQIFKEWETANTFEDIKAVLRKINAAYLRNCDSVKLSKTELELITSHIED